MADTLLYAKSKIFPLPKNIKAHLLLLANSMTLDVPYMNTVIPTLPKVYKFIKDYDSEVNWNNLYQNVIYALKIAKYYTKIQIGFIRQLLRAINEYLSGKQDLLIQSSQTEYSEVFRPTRTYLTPLSYTRKPKTTIILDTTYDIDSLENGGNVRSRKTLFQDRPLCMTPSRVARDEYVMEYKKEKQGIEKYPKSMIGNDRYAYLSIPKIYPRDTILEL
jgi:hypothetical protein